MCSVEFCRPGQASAASASRDPCAVSYREAAAYGSPPSRGRQRKFMCANSIVSGDERIKANAPPPVFFVRPGVGPSSTSVLLPSRKREGDGAPKGASSPSVTPSCEGVAPLGAPSRRFHCGAGPRFRGPLRPASGSKLAAPFGSTARPKPRAGLGGPPSASSSQGPVVVPGGAPAPPGCVASSPRPRAPARTPRAGATGSRPLGGSGRVE